MLATLPLTNDFLFENSPDCAKLLDLDARILAMNQNGQCLMEIEDFTPVRGASWPGFWPEAARPAVEAALEQARRGEAGQFVAFCPTLKGKPKWWDVRVTPVHDDAGTLQGFLCVSRDVTAMHRLLDERRRAEAFSKGQKEALEQAVAGAPLETVLATLTRTAESYADNGMLASVLLLDDAGQCLRAGAAPSLPPDYSAAVDGLTVGPAAGCCGTAAFRKEPVFVRDIAASPLWSAYRELAAAHGLGSCWSWPILSSAGRVLGTFAFYYRDARDPSEREKEAMPVLVHTAALLLERHRETRERCAAEEELRHSAQRLSDLNRRKTEFLATLAHELRNPLAPIRNGLDVMRLANGNPATVARIRDMMSRQVDHMVHLIDDLLDMARIDSGKIELKRTRVDLGGIAAGAIEASMPMIETARHRFAAQVPDEPLPLDADDTRLSQVLTNLLANAVKYTPPGGHIELSVRRDGNEAVIAVSDTGIGIPAPALGTIFEMFSQVERSLGQSQGGLGIGLALVQRLVQMHGGSVVAKSPGEGKGSTFIVRLPLAHDAQAGGEHPGAADAPALPAPAQAPLNIVVADDNADAADSMATLLRMDGHAVAVANDGYAALKLAWEHRPDVVFLDIGMPGLTGHEVARLIRKSDEMRHALLVALTGWGTAHDRARAEEAGFDRHLTKPADLGTIRGLLGDRSTR